MEEDVLQEGDRPLLSPPDLSRMVNVVTSRGYVREGPRVLSEGEVCTYKSLLLTQRSQTRRQQFPNTRVRIALPFGPVPRGTILIEPVLAPQTLSGRPRDETAARSSDSRSDKPDTDCHAPYFHQLTD